MNYEKQKTLKEPLKLYREARPISYVVDPATGCWNVVSHAPNDEGYIYVKRNSQQMLAHRYSYELAYGPIPDGLFVCHQCDNPICINPAHLFLGTNTDNMQDAVQKGRIAYGERNGNSKLTKANVRAIRADTISTQSDLGREYGVSEGTIRNIKTSRSWGWLR